MAQALAVKNPVDLVRTQLHDVEALLEEATESQIEAIQEAARYVLGAGGKRVRPQLVLLATLAAGGSLERALPLAAACELVHTATLVHDDIVDDSDSRRGRMAVQFHIGNSASVLMGDYLVIRSFRLVARDSSRELWNLMVDTISTMCEGEVLQIQVKRDTEVTVEVYEVIIECKTAILLRACARIGGLLGEAGPATVDALTEFGYGVGMAFQIQDDILDFIGDEETLGKPVGGDLREGKVTLPVIYALQDAAPEDREELLRIYGKASPLTSEEIRRATQIIEIAGGFDRAHDHAQSYITRAKRELERVAPGEARDALFTLANQIVDRRS